MIPSGLPGTFTILIVDDEALVRNALIRILVREKYHVLDANSAAEALNISENYDGVVDLLITDHTLKTITGREVAEQLQRSRPNMKVLLISGHTVDTLQQEGGLIFGAEFLHKPFSFQEFSERVNRILSPWDKVRTGGAA